MNYIIPGKGKVSLTKSAFISEGGEGKVYGKGGTAYKIYTDIGKAIPESKIKELSAIDHPAVIKPAGPVLDQNGACAGFAMKWVRRAVPLAKLFTTSFRTAQGVTDDTALELLAAMREAVRAVHAAGCLIVDANEFNFLADENGFQTPYFIDVNSYQTPSFPATALLPSVRDFHSTGFSELTDWFGFAVIACQLFTGIHPYKGKHPKYTRKKMSDKALENRMRDNVSIFDRHVSLPPSVRNPDEVPPVYRNWFYDLFQLGKRCPPPDAPAAAVQKTAGTRTVYTGGHFEIKQLKTLGEEIVSYRVVHGRETIRTVSEWRIGGRPADGNLQSRVTFTPERLTPVICEISDGRMDFKAPLNPETRLRYPEIKAESLMTVNNSLFAHNRDKLLGFAFQETADGDIFVTVKTAWDIMPNSSRTYEGLVIQNVLGRCYLTIPGAGSETACHHVPVPELGGVRIIDAAYQNGVCMIMGFTNGEYHRYVIKFNPQFTACSVRSHPSSGHSAINFTVLDNGVAIAIPEDGVIEVFFSQYDNDRMNILHDPDIRSSMRLCKDGIIAKFHQGGGLYSIRMKNPGS